MKLSNENGLIEPKQLFQLLQENTENIKLIDATFGVGTNGDTPFNNFQKERIGNAVYFDIDDIADKSASLSHTAPAPVEFEHSVSDLGISNDDAIIIYDQGGVAMAACRVWWMFKLFGHDNVWVLNGGLPAWKAEELPLNTKPVALPNKTAFKVNKYKPQMLCTIQDIHKAIEDNITIIDARSKERFGETSYNAGCKVSTGHIPNSKNLPYPEIIDPDTKKIIPANDIQTLLSNHSESPSDEIIFTCGSGVTACILALGAYNSGYRNFSVYDGSWTEWSYK